MSIIEALYDRTYRLFTGIEEDGDGSLRVYLGARYKNIHTHVDDPDAKDRARRAWAGRHVGHQYIKVPDDSLCDCPPPADAAIEGGGA